MNYDLSILIPARNEMFISRTVDEIMAKKKGNTEVIVGLDGEWANPPINDYPDLTIFYSPKSLGQREMTNQLCRLSKAKYVMKIDAHVAVDEGFDVKMMEKMQDNYTMVPLMRNLHAFDWVCPDGHRRYQGPSGVCTECGKETTRDILWRAKESPRSTAFRFDKTLHFQYHNDRKNSPEYKYGLIVGYRLSFDPVSVSPKIVDFFTDLTLSHTFTSSRNNLWFRENMPSDTVSLELINDSRGGRDKEILFIGNKSKMKRVTASSIFTNMVNNWDILSSTLWDITDNPGVKDTMCECFLPETMESTVSSFIDSSDPVPAGGSIINSDMLNKLNNILGGQFTYSENSRCFHNGSVTLIPIRDKYLNSTLTIQGSCFMLTREKYWELNICDPEFGSWGQQGVEVALKTWMSGGRVVCNQTTWYAHMFRTQGGDFGFPYPQSGKQVDHARKHSRELFMENKWPQAIRTFEDVLQQFYPVPDWHDDPNKPKKLAKGIIYYTHGVGDTNLIEACRRQLTKGMKPKHIVSISTESLDFGKNLVLPRLKDAGFLDMFTRIIMGLEASTADIIFFCEHDVLYHPSHFDFIPPEKDKYYYNTNIWRVRAEDGFSLYTNNLQQLSGLCAYRETLLTHYRKRLKMIYEKGFSNAQGFEPGTHGREERIDDLKAESYQSQYPNLDIRHATNSTPSRWKKEEFRNQKYTEGWTEKNIIELDGWNNKDLASLLAIR